MTLRTLVLLSMVLLAALARLLPHPPNFSPVAAMALFGAAHYRSRWLTFLVPLTAMFVSDLALEVTTRLGLLGGWMAQGRGFHDGMWIVYGSVVVIAVVGLALRKRKSVLAISVCVLAGSVIFYLLTNFAWWAGYDLYPHTLAGLMLSYEAAIPFFHWTLLGDTFFATVLFGGFALAERRYPALQASPA